MEVSMDCCPYSARVTCSIVCCYILHDFFRIIAQDMEVLVFCLFYTPLQLLTCTGRLLGLCLSSPVTSNKARKC